MNRQPVFWQLLKNSESNEAMENGLVYPSGVTPSLHGLINELIDVTDIHMDNYPGMMRSDVPDAFVRHFCDRQWHEIKMN